jgi:hypothetical protein
MGELTVRTVHTGRYIYVQYCEQCPRASQWQVQLLVHYIRGRYGINIVASTCTSPVTYCHRTVLAKHVFQPRSVGVEAFLSRLGHGAFAFSASDPPTSDRIGELRDKFP